ncbi:MAG TPA: GlsB/YeaQ/YmgE family stress response membrane protein [Lacipirellulaceae bacterium]|nr:GlsB/YeaQ/YmgE family stress response membrane protein [Lacipirellulaceae bacterium]
MHILGWIVFGLIVGAIARLLMPGRQPMGIILTILLGIAGSFFGGWIGTLLHGHPLTTAEPSGWLGAIIGAFLILFLYGLFANRSTNAP